MTTTGETKQTATNYMTSDLTKKLLTALKQVIPAQRNKKHVFVLMEREGRIFFSNAHMVVQVDKEWVISFLYKNFKIPISHEWWEKQTDNNTKELNGRWEYTEFPYSSTHGPAKKDWAWLPFATTTLLDSLCTDKPGRFTPTPMNLICTIGDPITLYDMGTPLPDESEKQSDMEKGILFMQTPYSDFLTAFRKYYTNLDIRAQTPISCVCLYVSHNNEFVAGIMPTYFPSGSDAEKLNHQLKVAYYNFLPAPKLKEEKADGRTQY